MRSGCSSCGDANARHYANGKRLCDTCHPKDEHGNLRCLRCQGLTCAACDTCDCLRSWGSRACGVHVCDDCKKPFCNVACHRRGDCREKGNALHRKHYDRGIWSSDEYDEIAGIDCNAPLGIGCQCLCCQRLIPTVCSACEETGPCTSCSEEWNSHSSPEHWKKHWSTWWVASRGTLPPE